MSAGLSTRNGEQQSDRLSSLSNGHFSHQARNQQGTIPVIVSRHDRTIVGGHGHDGREYVTARRASTWTNRSVRKLLSLVGETDPIAAITQRARTVALDAMDKGWMGPPFDPIKLADHLGIFVTPRHEVREARTVPAPGGRILIEFNPHRPSARVRYSIAHEIAHTLFPDCLEQVRNRGYHSETRGDDWQLEAVCNVGAAELLMPMGSLKAAKTTSLTIENALTLRKQFEVSMEALLIRIVRLADTPAAMFCASRSDTGQGHYSLNYAIASRIWGTDVSRLSPPSDSALSDCTAIGHTTIATEIWAGQRVRLEAVGIPPYPGSRFPRVVGLLKPFEKSAGTPTEAPSVRFVRGNALQPRGTGPRVLVHIVNDKTPNWGGGGFAQAIRSRWPAVQSDFRQLVAQNRRALTLGSARIFGLGEGLWVASVVAQKGYGESARARVRYSALRQGLESVAAIAREKAATVHMPRIGTGQGGGSWSVIEDIIQTVFNESGISVTVYDLPGAATPPRLLLQDELSFTEEP